MKNTLRILSLAILSFGITAGKQATAQLSFVNANNKLTTTTRSGCAVTVVDVNKDGLDDIVRLDEGHLVNLELQQRNGDFINHFLADIGGGSAWAMTMADIDQNGWKDMVADGSGGIRIVKIFENSGIISSTIGTLSNSGFFLQNATFCDMNNDGWIDLFGCDDNDASKLYLNDGAGNLNPSTFVNFAVNPGITYNGDPADSGNYGSAWIDFDNDGDLDLYVAHCRQSTTNPTDLRRINRLFVNDGNNNYTEQADTFGIAIGWQSWTSTFGDIDNDGDLDLLLANHDYINQIFENDGTGHYTELMNTGVTNGNITPIESVMQDFDNDGFLDILIAGSEWLYFKNNGNKTFTRINGLFANDGMVSFATGDLNHDGFVDIFSSYGDIYQSPSNTFDDVLYLNNRNSNNFITFDLEGTISNEGAIGARATIYGPWGVQIREVRAGESYGTCNSFMLHFGLGQETVVDSAVIWFPSGNTTTILNVAANQFVKVVEGGCTLTGNIIPGPYALCTGQTLTLNAPAGFASYLWNDGSTGTTVSTTATGLYNVMVTDASGCSAISPTIEVVLNPDETPTVTTADDLIFCEGTTATLTSTPATSYLWSDGSTTQSIVVTQTGNYAVTIQGTCASFTSSVIDVEVLAAPLPVGMGASSPVPASVVLTATGNNLNWYDLQTGGTLLGSGSSFATPVINTTTTYWVDATTNYAGAVNYTGQTYHEGSAYSGGNNTNGSVEFDVLSECILSSVKVYTDMPGDREIQVLDGSGAVVHSLLVNIPVDTSLVTLNFNLMPGFNYSLTTNETVNNQTLGTITPRLQRSNQGVSYPYDITGLVSLTGSNQGAPYYYYFYDWEVTEPSYECVSARVPVVADITTGINEVSGIKGIMVYPNPANQFVTLELKNSGVVVIELTDVAGRMIKTMKADSANGSKVNFDLSGISAGSYHLKMNNGEESVVKKLTIN